MFETNQGCRLLESDHIQICRGLIFIHSRLNKIAVSSTVITAIWSVVLFVTLTFYSIK